MSALSINSANAADILFVSFHPDDNTPSAAAAAAGFTQAPDLGYTQLLRNNGHNVTRYLTRDIPEADVLNAADLVIISRSVPSGNYELDAETAAWNGLTVPTIILNGYIMRSSRLGFTTGTTIPDVSNAEVRLTVSNPAHPIFAGIALDGANTMVNPYAHSVSFNGITQRGISVNTSPVAGGGTILATVGTAGDAAFGGLMVAEWNAGATMGNSPPDTLGGRRLVVLTGSRENSGLTSEGAGIYDLDPDGAQILLNAIDYLVPPEPLTYRDAVMADGPVVYYSFSDSGTTAANSGSAGAAADGTYLNGALSGAEAPRPPQFAGFEADNVALQLDGADDFVQGPQAFLNTYSNVTLSGWIRRAGAQRNRTGLFGQDNVIEFGYIDNGTLQAWVDDFQTPVNIITPFPDLEWDHVALVVNGDALQMTVYTNGVAAGSAPLPGNFYDSLNSMAFLAVGGDTFGNGVSFNGQIDEAAVFDKALTGEQIANHYFSAVAAPPVITQQPVGTTIFEGQTLELSVGAVGTPRLRYQWLYFSTPIPGQTQPTLVISNALPDHSGTYSVEVRNDYGTNVSIEVDAIVNPTQPPVITAEPQSTTRYAGRTATFTVAAIGGASLDYQWQKGTTDIPGATGATLTLNNVSASDEADYRAIVSNSAGATTSAVAHLTVIMPVPDTYEAAVVSGNPIAYWRLGEFGGTVAADAWGGNDGIYSNVVLAAAGAIQGDADFAADFTGNSAVLTPLSLNNTPAYTALGWMNRSSAQAARTGLWGQNDKLEFGYISDNQLQVWTDGGLNISPNPYPDGEWGFLAVVSDGSTVRLYTNGLLAGSRTHTIPANNNNKFNIGGGGIFDVVTANGNYFNGRIDEVAVYNRALSAQEVANLYFIGSQAAPVITAQPQGTNFFEGGTLTLCVSAAGAPPLSYKWLFFGMEVPGQSGSCLVIPNATPADSGTYQVEVSSPFGSTLSAEAVVDVLPANPPVITQNPQSATRYAGASVTFTAVATGSSPITYQWQRNGADVPGATGASLTLNNLQAANAGDYALIAANFLGRATSAVATLTILTPPAGSYEAAVVSGGAIAYWRLGESSGATAFDYVGGNHGTYNNVTLGVDGAIAGDPDTAAGFDGTSSYVGTPLSLNGLSTLTMTGWIRRNGPQNNRTGLFGQNDLVEFGYIDNNTIQAWVDNFTQAVNVTPNPIPDQQWGFVALTLNNGALTVQVNEGVDGTVTLPSANYGTSADLFNIGGGGIFDTLAANGNWFNGQIDEVAVYNRALTTAELDALYRLAVPPVSVTCPADIAADTDPGQCCATVAYTATGVGGTPTCSPPSGSCFMVGVTTVNCSVTDGVSTASCSFTVTVRDRQNPQITCPANIEVAAAGPNGSPVTFAPSAVDNCTAPTTVVCVPPSGGTFPIGTTTVTCTATDGAANSASCTFTITVRSSNNPPTGCTAAVIPEECATVAADGTVSVISVNGADACVTLQGSATDPEGQPLQYSWWTNGVAFALGAVATNCFELGCHTVTFVASDPNEASCVKTLNVCVITASEAVEECMALVDGSNVTRKNLRPLIATLKAAAASFDRGDFTAGLNQLNAFENKVRAQIAPANPAEAEAFIECVQRIVQSIGCGVIADE